MAIKAKRSHIITEGAGTAWMNTDYISSGKQSLMVVFRVNSGVCALRSAISYTRSHSRYLAMGRKMIVDSVWLLSVVFAYFASKGIMLIVTKRLVILMMAT